LQIGRWDFARPVDPALANVTWTASTREFNTMAESIDNRASLAGLGLAARGGAGRDIRQPWMVAKSIVTTARLSGDLMALLLTLWAARQWVGAMHRWMPGQDDAFSALAVSNAAMPESLILGCAALGMFAVLGHYSRRMPMWSELQQILLVSTAGAFGTAFLAFALHADASRLLVVGTWALFPVTVLCERRLVRGLLESAGLWRIPTLILGEGDAARDAAAALTSEPAMGYEIVGQVPQSAVAVRPGEVLWRPIMRRFKAHLVILAPAVGEWPDRAAVDALVCEAVPFALIPPTEGLPVADCTKTHFFSHDTVMLSYRNNLMQPVARAMKIVFDLALAGALLLALSPAMLIVAMLVRRDGGPALYGHTRIGAGGRLFKCLKFRSMVANADDVLNKLLAEDQQAAEEWRETQKLRNDPRVTRIGAFLRKTSLDELPQLFNVLRLEMSLVGPRPIVMAEVERYKGDIQYYFETRPGVTGLWQVSGRNDTSYAHRVHLDSWYVKNWTLWHDIAILAKTLPAVLQRRGAC
jgi:Undecaprenyl-phosphate galactose phosphotransferase WbaP